MSNQDEIPHPSLSSELTKRSIGELIIAGTAVAYAAGFVVSNLYLGSLGALNLDVIRVSYITSGILFFVFVGSILYPLSGIFKVFAIHLDKRMSSLASALIGHTFNRYGRIFLLALFLSGIATFSQIPTGIPSVTPPESFSDWLDSDFVPALLQGLEMLRITSIASALVLVVFFSTLILINPKPKDRERMSRPALARDLAGFLFRSLFSGRLLAFVFGILAIGLVFSLVSFLAGGQEGITLRLTSAIQRFLFASFLIYALVVVVLLVVFVGPRPASSRTESGIAGDITLAAILIGILLPIYALSVYPMLPQQIGGGLSVPVRVLVDDVAIREALSETESYLVDRTSDSLILMMVDSDTEEIRLLEVSKDLVISIEYPPLDISRGP